MQTFKQLWYTVTNYKLVLSHPHQIIRSVLGRANGCGAKGGINFPDSIWWCDITSACNIHDIDWELATSRNDLKKANTNFRTNMERIIDSQSSNRFTQWIRLKTMSRYYRMVKLIGTPIYAKKRNFT